MAEYTWDYRNRLTNVTVKDSSEDVIQESDYTYDAFDKRIGVSVDPDGDGPQVAEETWTVYDGMNPYADFDGSESLTTRYLYGPVVDMILARLDDSGDIAWYLTDHLGSVRDLADTQGNVIDHVKYDSFGSVISESSPTNGDRFKFTGREYDEALEQYYYRARHYAPAVGRFISEDPIGFAAGDGNLYRYVGNLPTIATDPSGLSYMSLEMIASGGASAIPWFLLDPEQLLLHPEQIVQALNEQIASAAAASPAPGIPTPPPNATLEEWLRYDLVVKKAELDELSFRIHSLSFLAYALHFFSDVFGGAAGRLQTWLTGPEGRNLPRDQYNALADLVARLYRAGIWCARQEGNVWTEARRLANALDVLREDIQRILDLLMGHSMFVSGSGGGD